MRVLDIKSFIRMNESDNHSITDIALIEDCFDAVAKTKNIVLDYDKKEVLQQLDQENSRALSNLMHCDIPYEVTDKMMSSIEIIFSKYINDNFWDYASESLSNLIPSCEDYSDFKRSANDEFESILSDFLEEKNLFTLNVSIGFVTEDYHLMMYFYYEPDTDIPSIHAKEWEENKGDKTIKLPNKIYESASDIFYELVNEGFSDEDFMPETKRIFGSEEGYWDYKGRP